jgi:hypothetical protein
VAARAVVIVEVDAALDKREVGRVGTKNVHTLNFDG